MCIRDSEISMETNLLETREVEEVEEAGTEMVETIIGVETLGINLVQAKNSMVTRKVRVKNENPKIRVTEITNVNLNNYSRL